MLCFASVLKGVVKRASLCSASSPQTWGGRGGISVMTLALVGATASGKTGVGVRLAQLLNAEIVSADSVQVYKRLDIGSAKPTADEQARAVFHGMDIVNPDEDWTLAQHKEMGADAIADITRRGRVPLVVGGTGLYVRALTSPLGIPAVPPNAEFRARWQAFALEQGNAALHDALLAVDPETAARLHVNDVGRHIRALEVRDATGVPLSEWHRRDREQRDKAAPPAPQVRGEETTGSSSVFSPLMGTVRSKTLAVEHLPPTLGGLGGPPSAPLAGPGAPLFIFGLHFPDRRVLYERIETRVDAMFSQGFVDEVRQLLADGCPSTLKSMSSLGYRHVCRFLCGEQTLDDAIDLMKRDTRRFARRQLVWFRADPRIHWVDAGGKTPDELAHTIASLL